MRGKKELFESLYRIMEDTPQYTVQTQHETIDRWSDDYISGENVITILLLTLQTADSGWI